MTTPHTSLFLDDTKVTPQDLFDRGLVFCLDKMFLSAKEVMINLPEAQGKVVLHPLPKLRIKRSQGCG